MKLSLERLARRIAELNPGGGGGLVIPTLTDDPRGTATAGTLAYFLGCLYIHATTATDVTASRIKIP